jgi:hypothetical protein
MTVTFTTCPFEVIAGDKAGIVIEDRKTGQSWRLSNQQAREFGRLIGRHRRLATSDDQSAGWLMSAGESAAGPPPASSCHCA